MDLSLTQLATSPLYDCFTQTVPSYGIDARKRLSIPMLIRLTQEAALRSTLRLGVSVFDLEPHQLGWVLLGQRLELHRCPTLSETFLIHTCPVGFERVFTFRDFHLRDTDDRPLGVASSTWMLMDLRSRRMATIPDWIKVLDADTPPKELQLPRAPHKYLPLQAGVAGLQFRVGFQQLDFNRHLSNPYYVEWMLEDLPLDLLDDKTCVELSIQYRREARYGETVRVVTEKGSDGLFQQSLFLEDEPLASMQTRWA